MYRQVGRGKWDREMHQVVHDRRLFQWRRADIVCDIFVILLTFVLLSSLELEER